MSEARARRLAERIHVIVAEALKFKVKDPRVEFVTVTDVRVTADLREATVFYTVYGDELQHADAAKALASATGMLRSEVGAGTGIKFTPTLSFVLDSVPDTARHLDEVLKAAAARDAEIAALAANASYAGDPNPYKEKPSHDDDED